MEKQKKGPATAYTTATRLRAASRSDFSENQAATIGVGAILDCRIDMQHMSSRRANCLNVQFEEAAREEDKGPEVWARSVVVAVL